MKKAYVLVTAVGGIVGTGLVKCLRLSNQMSKSPYQYNITGTDITATAAGLYRCNSASLMPPASEEEQYVNAIVDVCNKKNIDGVFVASDSELPVMSRHRKRIEDETGAVVFVAPPDIISVARDKWQTYLFCKKNDLPYAESTLPDNRNNFIREFGFPLVVKPREGYGSIHFYLARNSEQLEKAISAIEAEGWHAIIQRYIQGNSNNDHFVLQTLEGSTEFTTGITLDSTGKKILSSIAINKILKHGQTYKALIDDFPRIRKAAEITALKLKAPGSINVQVKLEGDSPIIFEINPRFSATCPMRAVAGVNEPDIVFRNSMMGEVFEIKSYERLVCMRFLNELYVPFSLYEECEKNKKIDKNGSEQHRDVSGYSLVPDYF